ncbi:MAG: YbaK/EbsC family protein [Motiliproteus sp.]
MSMPAPLSDFLNHHHVEYSILKHKPTPGSLEVAQAAAIPLQQLVYAVMLQQISPKSSQDNASIPPQDMLMVLIPASHHLDDDKVTAALGQPFRVIDRQNLKATFKECQPGVIPGLGQPFNLPMLADTRLFQVPQLYLEDGDNTELIKIMQSHFLTLMSSVPRHDLCVNRNNKPNRTIN